MSEKNVKFLRGQVRQVVKELLPQVFTTESVQAMQKMVTAHVDGRVDNITKMVKETLSQLDQRSKDMQNYVVRNVGMPTAPTPVTAPEKTE